ncbi:MAG: aminotransferase class IV [Pseudomonadota bacterium]
MKAWLNGELVEADQVKVPLLSHSFSRGSALFEVVDIVTTQMGPAYFGLEQHLDRLLNSARLTYMELPQTKDELLQAHLITAKENKITAGLAKSFAYYPAIELTPLPADPKVDVAIFCLDPKMLGLNPERMSAPAEVMISSYRKVHPESVPVHAKVVGNYVNAFLARMEAKKKGYDEVIMLDTMGYVAEGAVCNTFFVRQGVVVTPSLRSILPGVTRAATIEVARDMGLTVVETDLKPEDIFNCEEAFYSASLIKIQPIKAVNGQKIGAVCPGPVTRAVMDRMKEFYAGGIEKFRPWFTVIP